MAVCASAGQMADQAPASASRQAARTDRARWRRPMGTPFTSLRLLPRPAATEARVTKEHDGGKSKARSRLGPALHKIRTPTAADLSPPRESHLPVRHLQVQYLQVLDVNRC